jgi:hypothetical protein
MATSVIPVHLAYPREAQCPTCDRPVWLQYEGAEPQPCAVCVLSKCSACRGTGISAAAGGACSICRGTGRPL